MDYKIKMVCIYTFQCMRNCVLNLDLNNQINNKKEIKRAGVAAH